MKQMSTAATKSHHTPNIDMSSIMYEYREEIEVVDPMPKGSFYYRVHEMMDKFAATKVGQFVIERVDYMLRTIEETAEWSLPQNKELIKLKRPLPWIPFLLMIITLRFTRIWLSLAALVIGNGPVTPHDVVYFIQTRRRKLRFIRVQGLKVLHNRSTTTTATTKSNNTTNAGLLSHISGILSRAICCPGQQMDASARRVFVQHGIEQLVQDKATERQSAAKRPRDDEVSDSNLTFSEMLLKYAAESSSDDADFIPNPEDDTNDDDTTSSGTASENEEINDELENDEMPKSKSVQHKNHEKENSAEILENGEPIVMANPIKTKSIIDVTIDKTDPKGIQKDAGGNKNVDNRVMDVVNKNVLYKPKPTTPITSTMKIQTTEQNQYESLNGSKIMENQKAIKEHTNAVGVKPKVMPTMNTTATAEIDCLSTMMTINTSTTSTITTTSTDIDKSFVSLSSQKSSNSSSSESSTSLDSVVAQNVNILNEKTNEHLSANTISSASSTEDIFYSPIGSPDFNAFIQSVNKTIAPVNDLHNVERKFTEIEQSTPKADEDENFIEQQQQPQQPQQLQSVKKPHHIQSTQKPPQGNQHHQQNRYRGNRRR